MIRPCEDCGKGPFASVSKKAEHKSLHCPGVTAKNHKGEGSLGVTDTTSDRDGSLGRVTEETSNPIADITPESSARVTESLRSTPISISEIKGVTPSDPSDLDPLTEIRNAVGYLNARRDYLNRWELGFVGSMAFILNSKTNGDRARSITPDMVGKLFETKAKVEALEERDKREAEYDRVQRHFSDMKQDGHTWCDLCTKDKRERDEAKATWASAMEEQDAVLEQTRLRKERERLEASRMGERPKPAVPAWVLAQKRLAARKAVTPGAKNEGAADAR